jgi:hypothetical protein
MLLETILFDFDPGAFVATCTDSAGVPIELLEVTGLRQPDADQILAALKPALARRFELEPQRRRVVVWSDAGRLAADHPDEYEAVRTWLDRGVMALQHPWKLPMVGQVGVAVLQGELPSPLHSLRVGARVELDHDAARPDERRRRPRTEH